MKQKTKPLVMMGLVLLGAMAPAAGHCWSGVPEQGNGPIKTDGGSTWLNWKIDLREDRPRTTGNISIDRQEVQELRRCQQLREELRSRGKRSSLSCSTADH